MYLQEPGNNHNKEILYHNVLQNMLNEVQVWELIYNQQGDLEAWRLIEANNAALKAWGKTLEEVKGKTPDEIFPGSNSTAQFKPFIENLFRENKPQVWEGYYSGTKQTLLMNSIPMDGYFISTGLDISELKRTQKELENTNLRLTEAVKSGRVAIWDWNINSDSIVWDDRMYEIYQVPRRKTEKIDVWENALHPDDLLIAKKALNAALLGHQEYTVEYRIVRPSGEIRHIQADGTVIRDHDGAPIRMLGTNIDITETKLANEELKEALLRLNESVKSGGIGIWDWNIETSEVNFSKEYKAQLGYAEHEFGDDFKEWEIRVHPDDIQKTLDKVKWSIAHLSKNHQAEFRIRHRDGNYRWILSHASVIEGQNGQAVRMIGTHIDITERKLLEEELRQSQKMEAIGQLAGGIAHDFNNQLASIMGYSDLLEANLTDPKLLSYVRKITRAAEHSGNLTNQLLTFSRKQSLDLETLSIHFQLEDCIAFLTRSIDKRIQIQADLAASHELVRGDKSQLFNAFLNLGLNARDAMPEGGTLFISTQNVATIPSLTNTTPYLAPQYIEITFKDTGLGIPPENLNRIFEPFFTTKDIGKGTGMGLASVYGAIKQLGGNIHVESEPGTNTRFVIYLPLSVSETNTSEILQDSAPLSMETEKTILIVDDEQFIRELCDDFLKELGYQRLFASNGQEAIQVFEKEWSNIDLVILDMVMPEMNGKQVFETFKEINPGVKVVISSGYTADNAISEMLNAGALQSLKKPFKLSELKSVIEKQTQNPKL